MRVLVTGGAGFIGSHTVLALVANGHQPVIVDNFSNSRSSVIARLSEICERDLLFYSLDCTDTEGLSTLSRTHGGFDAVIHMAGVKAVAESVVDPLKYYDINLRSTLSVLAMMKSEQIGRLVFSSSATVYGSLGRMPVSESATTGAGIANPYGRTKFMIEELLRDVSSAPGGPSVTILRYFNPVGAHPSGLIGESPLGPPNNLMPLVARAALGGTPVSVFGVDYPSPDGTALRDYIHVSDLAEGHVKALEYQHDGVEAFNLGTGQPSSVLDVIRAYGEAADIEVPYVIAGRRLGDVPSSYADVRKAETMLGWKATRTLMEACRDDWNYRNANAASEATA